MTKSKSLSLFLTLALLLSLMLSFTVVAEGDVKAGPAVDKDTIVICTADETPSLTTANHNAVAGDYVNRLTHNGLFRLDNDLNPTPDLVESFKIEKDDKGEETIWLMTLHKDLKFCDGSPLKAEDVVASLLFAKEQPDSVSYTSTAKTVEAVDELTVKITTDGPSASLLYDLSHHSNFIVPKKLIDNGNDFNKNPIGAGPYKFVSWKRSEELRFEANEFYFNKDRAPKIKNIVWKIIPEGINRSIALEAGEVDYIIEFDSASVEALNENKNVTIWNKPSISHNWLSLNNEKEPFNDINVRKAINCAVNKEDVVDVALNGFGVVALSQTPMGMLGECSDKMDAYDMDKAQEYMEKWGGDPASITLDIICSNDTKRRAAEVIQANLSELGITANITSMDLATYLSETAAGNFTGFIGGYSSNEMMSFLKGVYLSENIGGSNKTRTNSPELDKLIKQSMRTVDPKERAKVLEEASVLLNELCPQIPLYQDNHLSAFKANLEGVFISAGGAFNVQEWAWK